MYNFQKTNNISKGGKCFHLLIKRRNYAGWYNSFDSFICNKLATIACYDIC